MKSYLKNLKNLPTLVSQKKGQIWTVFFVFFPQIAALVHALIYSRAIAATLNIEQIKTCQTIFQTLKHGFYHRTPHLLRQGTIVLLQDTTRLVFNCSPVIFLLIQSKIKSGKLRNRDSPNF